MQLYMLNMQNNMQINSARLIFCIFCILQYAEYAEYEPCTIILHIILHIYVRKYASPKINMQNSSLFIFCILVIYMHRPLC